MCINILLMKSNVSIYLYTKSGALGYFTAVLFLLTFICIKYTMYIFVHMCPYLCFYKHNLCLKFYGITQYCSWQKFKYYYSHQISFMKLKRQLYVFKCKQAATIKFVFVSWTNCI